MSPDYTPGEFAQRGDELFDIVNDRDEVIGQATRAEVHAKDLWHRAVHVLVFREAGDVFLQKRSMAKDSSPGCWDSSCSGHLDSGEHYRAAAVRELFEEIGLRVPSADTLELVLTLPATEVTGWEFVHVYRTRYEGPFAINPAEIDEGRWWSMAELREAIEQTPSIFTEPFLHLWAIVNGTQGR